MYDWNPRWMAEIRFRLKDEVVNVTAPFEEFEDLGDIVETGPDWNLIDSITVTLNRSSVRPVKEEKK